MPGLTGIYDPEFSLDLVQTREFLHTSLYIGGDQPRVEIYRPHDRIHLISTGRGAVPADAFSTEEFYCVLFGKFFLNPRDFLKNKNNFIYDFIRDGDQFLKEIEGTFLISVWLPKEKEFIIANDHFGTFPLNYFYEDNLFLFSSQLMIMKHIVKGLSIDERTIAELLSFGFILNGKTIFRKINRLWPATILRIKQKKLYLQNYFSVSYHASSNIPIAERLDHFSHVFKKSIHKRYNSENNTAAGLSGGYDSRVLWSVVQKMYPNTVAVTFGEHNSADIEIAKRLTQLSGIKHEVYILSAEDFSRFYEYISRIVEITEGYSPFDSFLLIPYYEWLQPKYGSLIDGTGSALYRRQIFRKYNYLLGTNKDLAAFVNKNYIHYSYNKSIIAADFYENYTPGLYQSLETYFNKIKGHGEAEDLLDIFYLHHFVGFRFSSDTLFQTHYLEAIHPFCDKELFKLITAFSAKERRKLLVHKHLISEYTKEFSHIPLVGSSLVIPYRIFRFNRILYIFLSRILNKSHLKITPKALRPRPVFDFNHAFRSFLQDDLQDLFSDPLTLSRPFWNSSQLLEVLNDHMNGTKNNMKVLMQIGLVEMLLRKFE